MWDCGLRQSFGQPKAEQHQAQKHVTNHHHFKAIHRRSQADKL
jgi:hypothetical protein